MIILLILTPLPNSITSIELLLNLNIAFKCSRVVICLLVLVCDKTGTIQASPQLIFSNWTQKIFGNDVTGTDLVVGELISKG